MTPCRLFTPDSLRRPTTVRETQSFNPEYCFALAGLLSLTCPPPWAFLFRPFGAFDTG